MSFKAKRDMRLGEGNILHLAISRVSHPSAPSIYVYVQLILVTRPKREVPGDGAPSPFHNSLFKLT